MEFQSPHYKHFSKDLEQLARKFELDPKSLTIEFYTPHHQAIVIERLKDEEFKIHINLEEERIISVKRLTENGNGHSGDYKEKYRRFMK